jgi:hypothetical protein
MVQRPLWSAHSHLLPARLRSAALNLAWAALFLPADQWPAALRGLRGG